MAVNTWVCENTFDYKIFYNGQLYTRKSASSAADLITQLLDDERDALREQNLDKLYTNALPVDVLNAAQYSNG